MYLYACVCAVNAHRTSQHTHQYNHMRLLLSNKRCYQRGWGQEWLRMEREDCFRSYSRIEFYAWGGIESIVMKINGMPYTLNKMPNHMKMHERAASMNGTVKRPNDLRHNTFERQLSENYTTIRYIDKLKLGWIWIWVINCTPFNFVQFDLQRTRPNRLCNCVSCLLCIHI